MVIEIIAAFVISIGGSVLLKFVIPKGKSQLALIILGSVFSAVCFMTIFTRQAIDDMYALSFFNFSKTGNFFLFLLRWMSFASALIIPIAVFYKNDNLRNICILFCLPVAVIDLILLKVNSIAVTGVDGASIFDYKNLLLILDRIFALMITLYMLLSKAHKIDFKDKSVYKKIAVTLPVLLLLMFPWHGLGNLFGSSQIHVKSFSIAHRIWLYAEFVIMLLLYFLLRRKSYQQKNLFMILFSVGVFIQYFSCYGTFAIPLNDLPLQICNLAMVLIPLSLILKFKPLFYFTYFINVLGALLATLVPDLNGDLFYYWTVNYIIEHAMAFILPILVVALGVMPKPNKKDFMSAMVVYTVYFMFSLCVNVIGSNYDPDLNYFYMMGTFLITKLPFAMPLYDFKTSFVLGGLTLTFRPLYQLGIYLVFAFGMFILHWVYKYGYSLFDNLRFLQDRSAKESMDIANMLAEMDGKPLSEPYHPEGKDMVKFTHFSKTYGKGNSKAVDNFNLEIYAGEVFGFLGHNGAGKSSVIKSMVGILPITEGRIEVCGYDVAMQPKESKMNIGYVPDNHAVYEKLTGREFINYVADLYKVEPEVKEERLAKFLDTFQMDFAIDRQIKSYSHGMKQKVTIIAALIHNPKVWVLDEPLTGLDPVSAYQVKSYMIQHAKEGNIVFFSSHILDVAENICDRVAIIKKGVLKGVYSLKELKEKNIKLETLYIENFYEE